MAADRSWRWIAWLILGIGAFAALPLEEEPVSAPIFFMAPGAPTPVAPFSHAVEVDGWCFITGQMPTDPYDDSRPLPPDIEGQTVRVMENLKIVLAGLKLGLEHVVFARAYITDFEANYPRMNKVYASYFPADRRPARTCIGVTGLARGAMVEIDLLAKRSSQGIS